MEKEKIDDLLSALDGSGSEREFNAVTELRTLGRDLPPLLVQRYRSSKNWKARSSCVYHCVRYARDVDDAFQLGLEALSDASKVVRYRACMLLANSLRTDAIPSLKEMASNTKDSESIENALAAIDAIENQNIDYFVDREHSGKMKLIIH